MGYIDTMLQYYLGIADPGQLPDYLWAEKFAQLQDIREREAKTGNKNFQL